MIRDLPGARVFTRNGNSIKSIREVIEATCRGPEIEGFASHDLRHNALNNGWLRGHNYFRIMATTGRQALNVFKRYNTPSKVEL